MASMRVLSWCVIACVGLMAHTSVHADYWDDFSDLNFWNDPNFSDGDYTKLLQYDANYGWEADNPQWWVYLIFGNPATRIVDANYGAIRLWAEPHPFIPTYAVLAFAADDNVHDPNTSETYWDDTTDHYIMCQVYYAGSPNDPCDTAHDTGQAKIFMHGHPFAQESLAFEVSLHDCAYRTPEQSYHWEEHHFWNAHLVIQAGIGTNFRNIQRLWIDPNGVRTPWSTDPNTSDPNDTTWLEPPERNNRIPSIDDTKWLGVDIDQWERDGFWILMQFHIDPNYSPGDPNGKWLQAAIWNGDKYAWDGEWCLSQELSEPYWSGGDPFEFYRSEGRTAVAAQSATFDAWCNGFPADVIYDDFEAREGLFDPNNPRLLDLAITNGHMGRINLNPDVPDPNDPNTAAARLCRYTNGTEVVLIAEPLSGKMLKQWTIYDPNHPGDANYTVTDTNSVLYLTMDADWEIEAKFKCGSSSDLVMPLGMVLLALFAGVVIRRKL